MKYKLKTTITIHADSREDTLEALQDIIEAINEEETEEAGIFRYNTVLARFGPNANASIKTETRKVGNHPIPPTQHTGWACYGDISNGDKTIIDAVMQKYAQDIVPDNWIIYINAVGPRITALRSIWALGYFHGSAQEVARMIEEYYSEDV